MWRKAQELIGRDAREAWLSANTSKRGKRYRRHRSYALPERAEALVGALGRGDAETVSAIMLYRYHLPPLR